MFTPSSTCGTCRPGNALRLVERTVSVLHPSLEKAKDRKPGIFLGRKLMKARERTLRFNPIAVHNVDHFLKCMRLKSVHRPDRFQYLIQKTTCLTPRDGDVRAAQFAIADSLGILRPFRWIAVDQDRPIVTCGTLASEWNKEDVAVAPIAPEFGSKRAAISDSFNAFNLTHSGQHRIIQISLLPCAFF